SCLRQNCPHRWQNCTPAPPWSSRTPTWSSSFSFRPITPKRTSSEPWSSNFANSSSSWAAIFASLAPSTWSRSAAGISLLTCCSYRGLNCLVAFELKIEEFQPEHLGKLEFYLEALDRDVKKP